MSGVLRRTSRELIRRGILDGLLGGNGIWLALGAVAWLARYLARTPSTPVVREQIRVGETITVRSLPPLRGRTARKAARRQRKAAGRGGPLGDLSGTAPGLPDAAGHPD